VRRDDASPKRQLCLPGLELPPRECKGSLTFTGTTCKRRKERVVSEFCPAFSHPANPLRVVDALIKANKDFDMTIFPDASHGLPYYSIRKQWDYFVTHLLGADPPKDCRMMDRPPFQLF